MGFADVGIGADMEQQNIGRGPTYRAALAAVILSVLPPGKGSDIDPEPSRMMTTLSAASWPKAFDTQERQIRAVAHSPASEREIEFGFIVCFSTLARA